MRVSNASLQRRAGEIRDWLLETAVYSTDLGEALNELCHRIVAAGVPVARVTTAVQLINASNQGVGREWRIGQPIIDRVYPYGPDTERTYERSPFAVAQRTGEWVILKPLELSDDAYGVIPELKSGGYTHYVCVPLMFSSGRKRNGVTFSTREPKGFTAAHFAFFRAILPALRALMEIRAGERILDEILQTYVGNDPHDRILAGDIHRGSVTRIRSAILFSDLRGYTELSMTLQEEDIADLLNRYFDCIVPQVECRGGEVLKFIGDGVLAIFQDADGNAAQTCSHALDAAAAGLEGIAKANAYGSLPAPLIAGIALHYGQAAYGNVGSDERLDFTVIGRDINYANRITRLNARLQRPVLMSEAFAGHITTGKEYLGMHEFKGVPGQHPLYAPA
jgi:adenylate cyclase